MTDKMTKEKLNNNRELRKYVIAFTILFTVAFIYGFILYHFDLTLMNKYDFEFDRNPCTSENEYTPANRFFVCTIYHEEKFIDRLKEIIN